MKITYDKKVDAMYIELNNKATYHKSHKITDDVLVDYAKDGKIIGVEVLDASKNIVLPQLKEKITVQPA